MGRFTDAVRRWEDGDLSDTDLARLLEDQLISEWERARSDLVLRLQGESALPDGQPLSVRDLLAKARASHPGREPRPGHEPPEKGYDELDRLYLRLRADNWGLLADGLRRGHAHAAERMIDAVFLELRKELDDLANEENPLRAPPAPSPLPV
jgi:hypothetical protein